MRMLEKGHWRDFVKLYNEVEVRVKEDDTFKRIRITDDEKPDIEEKVLQNWQEILNLLAEIFSAPSALIMKINQKNLEVFMHNTGKFNPYEIHETIDLGLGCYCETVVGKNKMLEVVNAYTDPVWDHNPDIELDMIYYLGMPLRWPDEEIFGTICVLDRKERRADDTYKQILSTIRDTVERDMNILVQNDALKNSFLELAKTQKRYLQAEKLAALNSLVCGLSHELNTPLGVCLTSVTYLDKVMGRLKQRVSDQGFSRNELEDYIREAGHSIRLMTKNLHRSIDIMKDLKQVTTNTETYEVEKFDLGRHFEESISIYSQRLKGMDIDIKLECEEDLNVTSYKIVYSQIIMHMILNSIEHGLKNRSRGEIRIKIRARDGQVEVVYEDDGVGIDEEIAAHIFEPFYTTRRIDKKTGLGLYIVHHLIGVYLKGHISFVQKNRGVRFVIEAPLASSDDMYENL